MRFVSRGFTQVHVVEYHEKLSQSYALTRSVLL